MPTLSVRKRGVFILEAAVALAIIGLVLLAASTLLVSYQQAHEHFLAHRAAQLAAEGQMERFRAGARVIDGPVRDPEAGPRVELRVTSSPGAGDWRGLRRVTVTATVSARYGRRVVYELSGYVNPVSTGQERSVPTSEGNGPRSGGAAPAAADGQEGEARL